jgi:hypothetical protein
MPSGISPRWNAQKHPILLGKIKSLRNVIVKKHVAICAVKKIFASVRRGCCPAGLLPTTIHGKNRCIRSTIWSCHTWLFQDGDKLAARRRPA